MNARRLYNGEYAITDTNGRTYIATKEMWIVTSVDKRFSGWGMADGKINKRNVLCHDLKQAHRIASNMRMDKDFTYVGCRRVGIGIPYYAPSRYVVSWHHADDCPLWNK
jgi:hypothetical protein